MGQSQSAPRRPGLLDRFKIWLSNLIPIDSWVLFAFITLLFRRDILEKYNLLPAPDAPSPGKSVPSVPYRRPDASGTDVNDHLTGASGTPFARNMPPNPDRNPLRDPPVQVVAQKLLQRQTFTPAGDQLNVLAAAWIQFMAHDWMRGAQSNEDAVLDSGGGLKCPLHAFKFKKTQVSEAGTVINERTHWWDTSVVYGSDRESLNKVREFKGGRLIVGKERGVLPRNQDGTLRVGDNMNSWVGVLLLQELFVREHNAVVGFIAREHPHLAEDDEALFNLGRLVVAAVAAKIHTVDWTVELLKMDILDAGMNTNWYGALRALKIPGFKNSNPPGPMGLVGHTSNNHGVPFALTEEFVSVYRLHPLLPDGLPLKNGFKSLDELVGPQGEKFMSTEENALDAWDAVIKYPCGNLQLFNYPTALRKLTPTDLVGRSSGEPIDLAAIDLYRDRERGIRNYNDFRRALHMKPFRNYEELTGGDDKACAALADVYGPDGIEKVDLLVGNLAEKKIRGFAISETQFQIFIVMASRRLESDRFLNENFNEETYTRAGLAWVHSRRNLRDVLDEHFPEMRKHFKNSEHSAFKPTSSWSQDDLDAAASASEYDVLEVERAEPIA